jgi:hypothetical protein
MTKQLRGLCRAKTPDKNHCGPRTQAISKEVRTLIKRTEGSSFRVYDLATGKFTPGVPK